MCEPSRCACAVTETLLFVFGKSFAHIFGNSPSLIDVTVKMVTGIYAYQAINGFSLLTIPLLRATGGVATAMILAIVAQFATRPIAGIIIFVIDRSHSIFSLMWIYSIADRVGFTISLEFPIAVVWTLRKQAKEENKEKAVSRFNQKAM
jgi:Na+-driven multidrug efflux pump